MKNLVLAGGEVISPLETRFTNVWIADGQLLDIAEHAPTGNHDNFEVVNVTGCYVTPGLVDLQVNGGPACNLWDEPSDTQFEKLCRQLLEAGVTCFFPTLITDDVEHLRKNIRFLEAAGVHRNGSSKEVAKAKSTSLKDLIAMPGIHLEGPCLSPHRPGVHPKQHLAPLDLKLLERLIAPSVKLMTLAPELDPTGECLKFLEKSGVIVSLGHSNATAEEARQAFDRGVRLMTHTFNALPPLHHRSLGAVGAALLDDRVTCCLIADGLHLDPDAVKLIVRMKGTNKTVLVTDAAHVGTTEGTLVGSSIVLSDAVRNLVRWGVSDFRSAIQMATLNPARCMNVEGTAGSLASRHSADVVVWNKDSLDIQYVIAGGTIVYKHKNAP